MTAFMQSGLDGLLMGGVYALAALGISLIFGVMKITNFAHGALLTLGMYITFQIYSLTGALPYIAMVPAVLIMFAIGYLIQRGHYVREQAITNLSSLLDFSSSSKTSSS